MTKATVCFAAALGALAAVAAADDRDLLAKLQAENRELRARNALLEKQVAKLKARIEELEKGVGGKKLRPAPGTKPPGEAEPKPPTPPPVKLMTMAQLKKGGSSSGPTLKPNLRVGQSGRLPKGFVVVKRIDESNLLIQTNLVSPRTSGSGGRLHLPVTKKFSFVLTGVETKGVGSGGYVKTNRLFRVTGTRKATTGDGKKVDIFELKPLGR